MFLFRMIIPRVEGLDANSIIFHIFGTSMPTYKRQHDLERLEAEGNIFRGLVVQKDKEEPREI